MERLLITFLCFVATVSAQQTSSHVNVQDFGAKPDGITDNSPAISAAIKSMNTGSTLDFPCTSANHIYKINSPIDFGSMNYMSINGSGPGCYLWYAGSSLQAYAFSFAGAEAVDVSNLDFYSANSAAPPKTVLLLGRKNADVQSGQFKFNNIRVEGWATTAIVYSIASEENKWSAPTIIVNGGGARYAFYTSGADDLGVYPVATASNLSLWMTNFHLLDFSPFIDPTHSLIFVSGKDSAVADHVYRDGYLASNGGTGVTVSSLGAHTIARLHTTFENIRFENGYQFFYFDAPSAGISDLRLRGNTSAGVSSYIFNTTANTTLYNAFIDSNVISEGATTKAVLPNLQNSIISENFPYTTGSLLNSFLLDRTTGTLKLSSLKATSGRRYVCVDMSGSLVSQPSPCIGN